MWGGRGNKNSKCFFYGDFLSAHKVQHLVQVFTLNGGFPNVSQAFTCPLTSILFCILRQPQKLNWIVSKLSKEVSALEMSLSVQLGWFVSCLRLFLENSQGGLNLPRMNLFYPRHLNSLFPFMCHKGSFVILQWDLFQLFIPPLNSSLWACLAVRCVGTMEEISECAINVSVHIAGCHCV